MKKQIIHIFDCWGIFWVDFFRRILFRKIKSTKVKRILVVRKGTIGDHTVCQPIYLALQKSFPDQQLDLLTSNGGLDYAHINNLPEKDLFHQCFNFNDFGQNELFRRIKKQKYDAVIELPQDLDTVYTQIRNMFFYRFCNISMGAGWKPRRSNVFKSYRFNHLALKREWEKHRDTLQDHALGIEVTPQYLPCEPTDLPESVSKLNLSDFIAVAPGAKFKSKQWPYYIALVEELQKRGEQVLLVGGIKDAQEFSLVNTLNLCGSLSVLQSRFVLSKVKVLICNDSGPMHLAYAVGTPVLALFGGRSYPKAWWPPKGKKNVVLFYQTNAPVAYVGNKNADSRQDKHLANLSVDHVLAALDKILQN